MAAGTKREAWVTLLDPNPPTGAAIGAGEWALAGRHRVQALLAYRVGRGEFRTDGRLTPTPAQVRRTIVARNLFVMAAAKHVTDALRKKRVPCLVLKGVGLCDLAYPDVGCRPTGDIDLLVRREDVGRSIEALGKLGYDLIHRLPDPDRFHEAVLSYRGKGSRCPPVDLHWGLCSRRFGLHARFDFDLAEEEVWRDADLGRRRLSLEMTFLHVILHAFTNSFSMLCDFVDLLHVYRSVERRVDWENWADRVRMFRMGAVAAFALSWVAKWWRLDYPRPLTRLVESDLPLWSRLGFLREAPWRGDIGSWKERLAMPLFFQPSARIPVDYLRMVFDLVHSRA